MDIQKKDLRLGNFVSILGVPLPLSVKRFTKILQGRYEVRPIPLTEDWLIKLGLRKLVEPSDKYCHRDGYYTMDKVFYIDPKDFSINIEVESHITTMCELPTVNIEYVHHFQNIIKDLTGEELKLKGDER